MTRDTDFYKEILLVGDFYFLLQLSKVKPFYIEEFSYLLTFCPLFYGVLKIIKFNGSKNFGKVVKNTISLV